MECEVAANMGTPGSGRKRAPIKDRFSAEDEALSSIAREAEARLAAKRAARAEARDIRMRELERQQKEFLKVFIPLSCAFAQIQNHMPIMLISISCLTISTPPLAGNGGKSTNGWLIQKRPVMVIIPVATVDGSVSPEVAVCLLFFLLFATTTSSSTGLTRSYSAASICDDGLYGSYSSRAATTTSSSTGLTRSYSAASICDDGLYGSYSSRAPSECSWYSSGASSTRSSPVCSDFSDISETAADYFSRSNRRGSIVSDLDDLSIPDLDSLDEKCDKQYTDTYSRPSSRCATPALSAAALATLGGTSSRRGSGDAGSMIMDAEASISELRDIYDLKDQIQDVEGRYMQGLKELKDSLSEVEEKYKKAMVSNAQLDNEKANLIYQVDTLKDVIEEMEEQMSELRRETEDRSKELERQKHTCSVLNHKLEEMKEGIRQRDELIEALERQKEYFDCIRSERDELRDELADLKGKSRMGEKHGLVIIPEDTPNGDVSHESPTSGITVVTQEAAQVLESAGDGPLDVRLRKLADEKDELLSQIRKLKMQLEEERQKHSKIDSVYTEGERMENGTDLHIIEMQRDANRQISEYKFKLSKAEQEMATMEQNVNRLEGQVSRYKASADNAEKIEDELKAEKRKLQRELRTALDKIEEMEMTNNHLIKRLEKMKANRNALLSQQ
ncbi:leucine-rich repeat flightless-interacting 2-like isoform X1 [Labeo rohita]|uniref:Leucine-rich repeat flightless-interacting protein 2 n=1 Tax=Labeo rohita TaxID=84645 RepID=A0A498P5C6_LABRO|nr:leucine-rich repeat flightless-interacting 2-like isoform X1 [Labeo rohita]